MRLLPLFFAALPCAALTDTYTLISTPTAVTVYGGFALVTREVAVDVGAGTHELVLPDLPPWIDATSLRATVTGAQMGSTRLRNDALPPQPETDSAAVSAAKDGIDQALRALRDLEDSVQDARLTAEAAGARLNFLAGLASSATLPADVDMLASLGQMISAQTLEAKQGQIAAERTAREIEQDRDALEQDLRDAQATLAALTPPVTPKTLLGLNITAPQAGEVSVAVSYLVDATWQPTYDISLSQQSNSMSLRRGALINQNSGENWEGVSLELSTLAPSGQIAPSTLFTQLLRIENPREYAKLERLQSSQSADLAGVPMAVMEAPATAQAQFDGPGVRYVLPAPITIAQGAEGARVELDQLEFDARIFARAIPAHDTTAFLMAQATNSSDEPLLAAGSVQLFLDGSLVGRSSFAPVPAGGKISQAFGPIEDLQLTRIIVDRNEGDRGLISRSSTQSLDIRLGVENLGDQSWEIEMQDVVPHSEQEDLTVTWDASPPPDATDVDAKRGLLQWDLSLGPRTQVEVSIEQSIRWPEGKDLR